MKQTDMAAALKDRPLARAVVAAAGVTRVASNPNARYTLLL
jgi:hypothetical protein